MARPTLNLQQPQQTAANQAVATSGLDFQDPATRDAVRQMLGVPEEEPKVGLFGRVTGLLDAFRPTDDIAKALDKGVGAGVVDYFADIPKALGTFVTGKKYQDEYDEMGGSELFERAGIDNKLIKGAGGLLLDIVADPTTWVTFGTRAGAKVMVGGTSKALTRGGAKALKATRGKLLEEFAEKSADDIAKIAAREGVLNTANKAVPELADEIALKRLGQFEEQGAKVFRDLLPDEADELAGELLKKGAFDEGGFKFMGKKLFDLNPTSEKLVGSYIDPISTAYGAAKNIPGVGQQLSKAEGVMGQFLGSAGNTLGRLISTKSELTGGNQEFNAVYEAARKMKDQLSGRTGSIRREYKAVYDQLIKAVDNPDDLRVLPHYLEDLPEDRLADLPADLRESLDRLTKNKSEQSLAAAREAQQAAAQAQKTADLDLASLGSIKQVVDKQGVKRQVFEGVLSPMQTAALESRGISSMQQLLDFVDNPRNQLPETITDDVQKKIEQTISRTQAGKFPEVKKISDQIKKFQNDPRIKDITEQFKQLQAEARLGDSSVEALAKYYGPEAEQIVGAYRRYEDKLGELQALKDGAINTVVENNKTVRTEVFQQLREGDTPAKKLFKDMGVNESEFKQLRKNLESELESVRKLENEAQVKLSQVKDFLSPDLQKSVDGIVSRIGENTQAMIDAGAISDSSLARYLGRDYIETPGGKLLKEGKGAGQSFGKSLKSALDPRSATSQKKRVYAYLLDAIEAGGKTTLTEANGKEVAARLVEQLAKDEVKAVAAKQFNEFGEQVAQGLISRPDGSKLYDTGEQVLEAIGDDIPAKYSKHTATLRETGIAPEPLKNFFKNRGYSELTINGNTPKNFKNVFFDDETKEVLERMHKQFFQDDATNDLVKFYDKVHNTIKKSQTVWFPAFHVRNMISNVAALNLAGVTNPSRFTDAISVQNFARAIENGNEKVIQKLGGKKINGMAIKDIYESAVRNGVLDEGFFTQSLGDEIVNAGKVNALARMNPLSEEFIPSKVGTAIGQPVEQNARMALFLDRIAKGDDIRSAALKVKEVLFDYSELTSFEKNIMKRFVPYYTWTRKNAELHLRTMLTQPGRYAAMLKGFDEVKDAYGISEEEKAALPDWAKAGAGMMFGGGDGTASVVTNFGLPYEGFADLIEGNPLNQLGVMPKTAIEVGTGQNIFKGKAILDDDNGKAFRNYPQYIKDRMGYREETRTNKDGEEYTVYTVDPWAKYWVGVLLGRTSSTASKATTLGTEGDVKSDVLNLFTGVKKYNFDITEEQEKRNREEARALYDELVRAGVAREYTNQYIPATQKREIEAAITQR